MWLKLDADARLFFESRFRFDFSRVRIHTDARASESARAVNALAYTVGNDIFSPLVSMRLAPPPGSDSWRMNCLTSPSSLWGPAQIPISD
jgi:Domain of unknown function (DUF4157)